MAIFFDIYRVLHLSSRDDNNAIYGKTEAYTDVVVSRLARWR